MLKWKRQCVSTFLSISSFCLATVCTTYLLISPCIFIIVLFVQFIPNRSDGTSEDLDKYQPEIRGSLPDPVPMKGASPGGASEPAACNYLNKMDNTYWDSPSDKDYFSSNGSSLVEGERQSKFPDSLTGDWSNGILSDCTVNGGMVRGRDFNRHPCGAHDYPNVETEPPYRTAVGKCATAAGLHQIGSKVASCGGARSLADLISFGGRLIGSPPLDVKLLRPSPAPNNIKKRGLKNDSTVRSKDHSSFLSFYPMQRREEAILKRSH